MPLPLSDTVLAYVSRTSARENDVKFGMVTVLAAAIALFATPTFSEQEVEMSDDGAVLAVIDTMTMAFAAGDIDKVLTTYGLEAAVVGSPGQPVRGEPALRAMFEEFVAAGVNFTYGRHEVVVAGDTALHLMGWAAPLSDGTLSSKSLSVAVLKKDDDGGWKMVIDHPFGNAVLGH